MLQKNVKKLTTSPTPTQRHPNYYRKYRSRIASVKEKKYFERCKSIRVCYDYFQKFIPTPHSASTPQALRAECGALLILFV